MSDAEVFQMPLLLKAVKRCTPSIKHSLMVNEIKNRPFIFDQLLEAQKARNELMKWKLIIVAAIGSAGLSFFKTDGIPKLFLIIIFIPISCVYVDLLCRNLSIRSMRINLFASKFPEAEGTSVDIKYHQFYQGLKKDLGTSLESLALIWSTILIILIVTTVGLAIPDENEIWVKTLFSISGFLCLVFSLIVENRYQKQKNVILKYTKP